MTQPQLRSSLRDGEEGCGDSVLIRPLGSPSPGTLSHHSHPTPQGCLCAICMCPGWAEARPEGWKHWLW